MAAPIQNSQIQELMAGRIQQIRQQQQVQKSQQVGKTDGPAFAAILDDRLKLSGHAQARLNSRNIEFGPAEQARVIGGMEKAAAKGAKESLVLMDDVALVVSVKNRTVITSVDKANLRENVFTNIDSAVIV